MEIFKEIKGFEGYYEISNLGKVKNVKRNTILKPKIDKFGYHKYRLQYNNNDKYIFAHRIVAIAFLDNFKLLEQVNHINGIKNDNRIENLEWCSRSENIIHSYNILNRNKKATPIIRNDGKEYKTIKEAAFDNNVSTSSIIQNLKGKSKTSNNFIFKYNEHKESCRNRC